MKHLLAIIFVFLLFAISRPAAAQGAHNRYRNHSACSWCWPGGSFQ
jgi:hypothetical protein